MRYAYSVAAVRAAEHSLLAQQNVDDELMRLAARGVAATAAAMLGPGRRGRILVGPGGLLLLDLVGEGDDHEVEAVGGGELYMLQVVGDSMQDAGILNGDWVIIRSQSVAEEGEFVAALLDGSEATVKEFHRDSSGVWLLPHNDAYPPINGDDAEIMGKVVSVFRKL